MGSSEQTGANLHCNAAFSLEEWQPPNERAPVAWPPPCVLRTRSLFSWTCSLGMSLASLVLKEYQGVAWTPRQLSGRCGNPAFWHFSFASQKGFQLATPYLFLSLPSPPQSLGGRSGLALSKLQVHFLRGHHRDPGSESVLLHLNILWSRYSLFFRLWGVHLLRMGSAIKVHTLRLVTLLPWVFSSFIRAYLTQEVVTVFLKD